MRVSDVLPTMERSIMEFLVILTIGLLVGVGSYVTLSMAAAVLLGFIYVMLIPLVHELFNHNKHF